jgi:hypothetical protein
MTTAFIVALIIIFMPIFDGQNGLNYLDDLYNSISRGSASYIPKVKEESDKFKGNSVSVTGFPELFSSSREIGKPYLESKIFIGFLCPI